MPVLGICRGMQLINVALGGTLIQHLPEHFGHGEHRRVIGSFDGSDHDVEVLDGSLAMRAIGAGRARDQVAPPPGRRPRSARASRQRAPPPLDGRWSRRSSCPASASCSASSGTPRPTPDSPVSVALGAPQPPRRSAPAAARPRAARPRRRACRGDHILGRCAAPRVRAAAWGWSRRASRRRWCASAYRPPPLRRRRVAFAAPLGLCGRDAALARRATSPSARCRCGPTWPPTSRRTTTRAGAARRRARLATRSSPTGRSGSASCRAAPAARARAQRRRRGGRARMRDARPRARVGALGWFAVPHGALAYVMLRHRSASRAPRR